MGEIKPVSADIAFNKGVEYFTEIVFFYGVLFGITFYEIDKSLKGAKAQKEKIKLMEEQSNK